MQTSDIYMYIYKTGMIFQVSQSPFDISSIEEEKISIQL